MPAYCRPIVEYSTDPLSVTTPAWIGVTRFVQDVSWYSGTSQDLRRAAGRRRRRRPQEWRPAV
jgi:hypothetical protein